MKRLITKSDRLAAQSAQFEILTSKGYERQDYKDLAIFSKQDQRYFTVQIFRGTAAKPVLNKYYSSADYGLGVIEQAKKQHDRIADYKKERKDNKKLSTSANAAAAIRAELKESFPGIKFSVTSSNYAGGDSVRIEWQDGPTKDDVVSITGKYQSGHFDGMTDMYEYSNSRDDLPQSKYVFESRKMSEETRALLDAKTQEILVDNWDNRFDGNLGYRVWVKTSLPAGARVTDLVSNGANGLTEYCYRIVYDAPQQSEKKSSKEQTKIEPVQVKQGEINLVDYSEKAFAVIGDTKPVKDLLKEIGGKFNAKLSCGPGWIFSKKRLKSVQERITLYVQERSKKPFMALLPPDKAREVLEEWEKTEQFLKTVG